MSVVDADANGESAVAWLLRASTFVGEGILVGILFDRYRTTTEA
jgi:hypothetical protein